MKKYKIDYTEGSGSGCDNLFYSREDAQYHMNTFYTEDERKGLEVVEVEVGYLVTMQIGDSPSRYVWTTEDVDNGGCVDCPNGTDDCYNTDIEACLVRDELEEYAEGKGYTNVSFGIEEVIL